MLMYVLTKERIDTTMLFKIQIFVFPFCGVLINNSMSLWVPGYL